MVPLAPPKDQLGLTLLVFLTSTLDGWDLIFYYTMFWGFFEGGQGWVQLLIPYGVDGLMIHCGSYERRHFSYRRSTKTCSTQIVFPLYATICKMAQLRVAIVSGQLTTLRGKTSFTGIPHMPPLASHGEKTHETNCQSG